MAPPNMSILGGVNLLRDPRRIGPDECRLARNIVPVLPGIPSTRPGLAHVADSGVTLEIGTITLSLSIVPFSGAATFAAAIQPPPGSFQYPTQNTQLLLTDYNGANLSLTDMGGRFRRPYIFSFNRELVVLPGYPSNVPGFLVQKSAGGSGFTVTSLQWQAPTTGVVDPAQVGCTPQVGAAYKSRVVYGNLGPGFEDYVIFSDNFQPAVISQSGVSPFASNGRAIRIGNRDGDKVVAVAEIMLTAVGSPVSAGLLILKERSAYLATGQPNQTTDSGDPLGSLEIQRVSFDCSCAAPETVSFSPYGTFWAGHDDVWFFAFGQVPVRVGSKIRPALAATPATMRYKWTGAYFNGFYRLMVAGADQGTVSDNTPLKDQWWLDLRDGAPRGDPGEGEPHEVAKWWGPQQFSLTQQGAAPTQGTTTFAMDSRPGMQQALYGCEIAPGIVFDGEHGFSEFHGPSIVQYDSTSSRDLPSDPTLSPDNTQGSEIPIEIVTREYDFDDARVDKLYSGMEMNVFTSGPAQILVDAVMDRGRIIDPANVILPAPPQGFQLGTSQLGTGILAFPTQAATAFPNPISRAIGKTFWFHIYTTPGVVIASDSPSFSWLQVIDGIGTTRLYSIPIAPGFYASVTAFFQALCTAMGTKAGVTYTPTISGGLLHIANTAPHPGWAPLFKSGDTAANLASNRIIGAIGGLSTNVNPPIATTIVAAFPVFQKQSPFIQFGELNANVVDIPRRPSTSVP